MGILNLREDVKQAHISTHPIICIAYPLEA